ncbi:hypothetical protein [Geminisphaera colitermitum]|uniref:hypothetical protein n=1 Tax=Geminisphaera colitermitum TaxID=1148786 RepID=UPI000158CB96|nr:hypothetical protein [Geminisphaera colitermitum]
MNKKSDTSRHSHAFRAAAALVVAATAIPVIPPPSALFAADAPESSSSTAIFEIGRFDNSGAEFEQEGGARNTPQFYVHAGDYTKLQGKSGYNAGFGPGYGAVAKNPEPLVNNESATEGFPRSLNGADVARRRAVDIFFQLTPAQSDTMELIFETAFIALGRGSMHNIEFYLNGVRFGTLENVTQPTPVKLVLRSGTGLEFRKGGNVLSLVKTAPLSPVSDQPWIGIDAVKLSVGKASQE